MPVWLMQAWEWLKRNWMWLLLPIGVAVWVLARLTAKKEVTVVSPSLVEHDERMEEINAEAAQKLEVAKQKQDTQLAGIDAAHNAAVTSATQSTLNEAQEAQGDSEKVGELMDKLSQEMRK